MSKKYKDLTIEELKKQRKFGLIQAYLYLTFCFLGSLASLFVPSQNFMFNVCLAISIVALGVGMCSVYMIGILACDIYLSLKEAKP